MARISNSDIVALFRAQIAGLLNEYQKQKGVYDNSGTNVELKDRALNMMASVLNLQGQAVANLGNWNQALSLAKEAKTSEE